MARGDGWPAGFAKGIAQPGRAAAFGAPVPCIGTSRHSSPKSLCSPAAEATFAQPIMASAKKVKKQPRIAITFKHYK